MYFCFIYNVKFCLYFRCVIVLRKVKRIIISFKRVVSKILFKRDFIILLKLRYWFLFWGWNVFFIFLFFLMKIKLMS